MEENEEDLLSAKDIGKILLNEKDIENIKSKESWLVYVTRIQELSSKEKLTLKELKELNFYKDYLLSSEEEGVEIVKTNNLEKNYDAIVFQSEIGEPFDSYIKDSELFNEDE